MDFSRLPVNNSHLTTKWAVFFGTASFMCRTHILEIVYTGIATQLSIIRWRHLLHCSVFDLEIDRKVVIFHAGPFFLFLHSYISFAANTFTENSKKINRSKLVSHLKRENAHNISRDWIPCPRADRVDTSRNLYTAKLSRQFLRRRALPWHVYWRVYIEELSSSSNIMTFIQQYYIIQVFMEATRVAQC